MINFIKRAREIHGDKYCYDKSKYIDYRTPLTIICPIHGEFEQSPNKHLSKRRGCPKCGDIKKGLSKRKTIEDFIKEANLKHNNRYDYSISNYTLAHSKIDIICPIHGKFSQKANDHLQGHGCPKCNQSKLELKVKEWLDENKIENYIQEYRIPNSKQSFDFYLPDYKIAIECQGIQHFQPVEFFGGEKEFEKIVERDNRKKMYCDEQDIILIYIIYNNIKNINNYIYNNLNNYIK